MSDRHIAARRTITSGPLMRRYKVFIDNWEVGRSLNVQFFPFRAVTPLLRSILNRFVMVGIKKSACWYFLYMGRRGNLNLYDHLTWKTLKFISNNDLYKAYQGIPGGQLAFYDDDLRSPDYMHGTFSCSFLRNQKKDYACRSNGGSGSVT